MELETKGFPVYIELSILHKNLNSIDFTNEEIKSILIKINK